MRARHFTLESRDPGDVDALAEAMRGLVEPPGAVTAAVADILEQVRHHGDRAVHELTLRWDSEAAPEAFRVPAEQIASAPQKIDREVRAGLEAAIANVERLAEAEVSGDLTVDMPQGQSVTLTELPVRRAGAYVPGGRAAYPSSVVMCCVPARVAGVEQLAVATPPGPDGTANPVILAACALCGVEEVHLMGGAQAIAALVYGTATVAPVDVIVGPGNSYVQEAKRQLAGSVGIDGIAGPTELLVIADAEAEPRVAALDVAAQAEHGPDTLVAVASPSAELLAAVEREAAAIARDRASVQDAPLALVRTDDLDAAIAVANALAPEHLELACAEAEPLSAQVRTSGCVFVGGAGGAAFGDYAAGSNHVLPTGGAGRFSGPLGAGDFRRRQALVRLPAEAARTLAPFVASVARAEGFPVHAESAEARADKP
jgi:histidinol dehydrogenase